jgi:hypothetical protein
VVNAWFIYLAISHLCSVCRTLRTPSFTGTSYRIPRVVPVSIWQLLGGIIDGRWKHNDKLSSMRTYRRAVETGYNVTVEPEITVAERDHLAFHSSSFHMSMSGPQLCLLPFFFLCWKSHNLSTDNKMFTYVVLFLPSLHIYTCICHVFVRYICWCQVLNVCKAYCTRVLFICYLEI